MTGGFGSRLRVALDATPLLGRHTGVGVFCAGALQALAGRPQLDVRAFAVSWRRRQGIDDHVPWGVAVRQRPMPARPLHVLWGRTPGPPLEWFIGKVDVVHGTNFVVPPTRRAAAIASVHDLTPVHHPELCTPATLAFPSLIRRALDRGAWIHADSAFVAAEIVEAFGVDEDRVRVVHPGVPMLPALEAGEASRQLARWPALEGRRIVLSVGTSEPRKDLPGLVDAFAQLAADAPDVALVLAGPPGWDEAALEETVSRNAAAGTIVRTGWIDDRALSALLGAAHVLAYPSRYEGFGFPPLQAMTARVPVVATSVGSLPEVLADAALMVPTGDPAALAEALSRALNDDALRHTLIDAGSARAASFSWEQCGAGLEALYRDVAEAHA